MFGGNSMYKVLDVKGYEELIDKHHLSSLAAKVMACKKLSFTNKINSKDCYEYKDMDKVVSMILRNISDNKKIAIYGDYDVDGICSVSILYRTFKLLNYDVGYYVPNRYEDGYGLSSKIVKQMNEKGYSLLICVDNGIKAFDSIKCAKELGMNVIVLDHHQREGSLPNFDLYLHPEYSNFSEYNMCASSVCYYLSKALLADEDEICLTLAGIATIGDVMPLVEQNKLIANKAIEYLNKKKYRAINILNIDNKKYDENLLSMQIVPKLNSIGRICKGNEGNILVKFLTSCNDEEIKKIGEFIEKTNNERKKMTDERFNELDKGNYNSKIIVEKSDDMLEGINGIIAAKFVNKYELPAIIFSLDESKENYKGSARSVDDLNILNVLEKNKYIEIFGGHKGAAGLTIKRENYEDFVKTIECDCANNKYEKKILDVIEIDRKELSYKAYIDLLKFAPFGEGNPKPLFILKGIDRKEMFKSKDGKHILVNISDEVNLAAFNLSNKLDKEFTKYDMIFKLELNNLYSNKITCVCVDLEVNDNV
jgi:single-stranded-DNA-specific exonuclease